MSAGTVFLVVVGVLLALGIGYGVVLYNRLVALKHNVSQAWANIDVLLKQRHDELPKLVEVCRQYMEFEQETLARVMEARARVASARERQDVGALGSAESQLRLGLGQLFAVAEAYPDLKANSNFQHLSDRVTALENSIADRREYYNASVNLNNIRIEQFPDVFIARRYGFKPFGLLEFSEQEKADVNLKELFAG